MAMNRAEKAEMLKLRERASLTLPPYEKPKPIDVDEIFPQGVVDLKPHVAWWMNAHSMAVGQGCFTRVEHSYSYQDQVTSRGPGVFYWDEEAAYRALRWAVTERVMTHLGMIDERMAAKGFA